MKLKTTSRSSRPEVFCKKSVLRNFVKFTGEYLCQSLFFNKHRICFFLATVLCIMKSKVKGVFRTQTKNHDGVFFAETVNGFKPLTIFTRSLYRRCSTEF